MTAPSRSPLGAITFKGEVVTYEFKAEGLVAYERGHKLDIISDELRLAIEEDQQKQREKRQ